MVVCTAVWGGEYIDWFKRGLLESLKFPKNRAFMQNAHWIFCNEFPNERAILEPLAKEVCPSVEFIHSHLWDGIKIAIQRAHAAKRPFILAPPDNAFSEGCLESLARLGDQKDTVIAVPHVRVVPSFLDDFPRHNTPEKMVRHCFNHLHDSWVMSEDTKDPSACHDGGVFWKQITETTVAVTHRLPTAFFVNLTQEDVNFFNSQPILGCWDNIWPPALLINQQRWRLVGSSDVGFIVETTHPGRNVPALLPKNHQAPDSHKGNQVHNWVCREITCIFRSESPLPKR
jgi:hypothetical protein